MLGPASKQSHRARTPKPKFQALSADPATPRTASSGSPATLPPSPFLAPDNPAWSDYKTGQITRYNIRTDHELTTPELRGVDPQLVLLYYISWGFKRLHGAIHPSLQSTRVGGG